MSPAGSACIHCAAELAPDQEYCLDCGARQVAPGGPRWRRPLIAATVTAALAALALVLGYERMRDDAEREAATSPAAHKAVKQAAASDSATASDSRMPVPAAQLAAGQSP